MARQVDSSGSVHSSPNKQARVAMPSVPISDADHPDKEVWHEVTSDDEDQALMANALVEVTQARERYEQQRLAVAEPRYEQGAA